MHFSTPVVALLALVPSTVATKKHRTFYNGEQVQEGHPAGSSYDFTVATNRCLGNGPLMAGGGYATRFTGDSLSKAIKVPGTQCIILHPGPPNNLAECDSGANYDKCRFLEVDDYYRDNKPPKERALRPQGCFWDVEQEAGGVPDAERVMYCNSGQDWGRIEKKHWVQVGGAEYGGAAYDA